MRAFALAMTLIEPPVVASESDTIHVHAEFLSAQTEWCPASECVPVVVTVDGPDFFVGKRDEESARIIVRRGANAAERVDVGRVGVGDVRVGTGGTTRSFQRLYPREDELVLAGRLQLSLTACQGFVTTPIGNGTWTVTAPNGEPAHMGRIDNKYVTSGGHPLFTLSGRYPKVIRLGSNQFVVMTRPEITRTTEAFASPAKGDNP